MKNVIMMGSVAVLSLGLMVSAACSDSDTTATGPGTGGNGATGGTGATGGGGSGAGPIEVPTLGAQIDRKGRPAINTATTTTFAPSETRDPAEAAYNADDQPSTWAASYAADKAAQLAILDSLGDGNADDNNCGDQAFFGTLGNDNYGTLATVLSNDWLIIDSANSGVANCGYLGVELEILGADAGACGGRLLSDDVMDTTYFAVSGVAGFGDGIPAPNSALGTEFPYLTDPN